MNKKGFTLMEILVVVLIVIILVSMFSLTYKRTADIKTNEKARAMLVELANAAKLYNEINPNTKISGGFGDNPSTSDCPNCKNPCVLFRGAEGEDEATMFSYSLNPIEWGLSNANACGSDITFQGYKFFICNPYYDSTHTQQPSGASGNCVENENNTNTKRFAVMMSPPDISSKYSGKQAWITEDYMLENNYE